MEYPQTEFVPMNMYSAPLEGGGHVCLRTFSMCFPGLEFGEHNGNGWSTYGDILTIYAGKVIDGASGPAFDTSHNLLASWIHDCICEGKLLNYWQRHKLYWSVMRRQSAVPSTRYTPLKRLWRRSVNHVRMGFHWGGLIAFNWIWTILFSRRSDSDNEC